MLNALTVDVEDYFQVSAFEKIVSRNDWDKYESRVVANTRRLLRLFARHQVRATFFVLGWVGRKFPELIREIAEDGHEIGCHSYWHRLIYDLTPEQFASDLQEARDVLQQASGQAVTAFRAPSFSITERSLWALPILAQSGFRLDSSVFPIHHDRYGMPGARPEPHRLSGEGWSLWELPPAVVSFGKLNIPAAGGGYFRLYPVRLTNWLFGRSHAQGRPVVFYVHPWEIDPDQPRLPAPLAARWRHYVNLASTERKLDWLLQQRSFGTISDLISRVPGTDRAPAAISHGRRDSS